MGIQLSTINLSLFLFLHKRHSQHLTLLHFAVRTAKTLQTHCSVRPPKLFFVTNTLTSDFALQKRTANSKNQNLSLSVTL
ncbi:hypothetical protein BDB01DRAFT_809839, partial [Pilobolus umbonatus]